MLYIVLILVLGALGLLVAALITSKSLFAWISIVLSVLAALALFADWVIRRRAERRGVEEPEAIETEPEEFAVSGTEPEVPPVEGTVPAEVTATDDEPIAAAAEETREASIEPEPEAEPELVDDSLPDEEETDAADLLIVCELDDQVIVVDEHPRYHLSECRWLRDRDVIPIAVSEARELGFTPCARCGPDAKLAARARDERRRASR